MQRFVLGDGAVIAYSDQGAGPPLLLMHGFTGTARSHLGGLIEGWAARIADCRAAIVAASGHSIQDDQPQQLLGLIRAFLAELEG